jgi:hypothetical protein
MPRTRTIRIDGIEQGDRLWDVERAAIRMKEIHPKVPLRPTMLILKCDEIVAEIYESRDESRALVVHTRLGFRKIDLAWHDCLSMLYRTAVLMLQKTEGTAVIFFGEHTQISEGHGIVCAMKWTARQFLQPPPLGVQFPETQDSILQPFCIENERVRWLSEANTAQQFVFPHI